MPQTGNFFIGALSQACIFLPLLPVIIIFFKKIYHNEVLNFLMILCLLNFLKNILLFIPGLIVINQNTINNIFSLPELILLLLIFRSLFFGKRKNILTLFLIAFISSILTYYLLNGIDQKREAIELLQQLVILIISSICLFELIINSDILLFKIPLLWIAIGTIFYFFISVLLMILNTAVQTNNIENTDSQIILETACVARYIFYLLAALYYQPRNFNVEKNEASI